MINLESDVAIAVERSHTMRPRVTAYYGNIAAGEITIADGSVSYDESSGVQSRCSVKIPVRGTSISTEFDPRNLDVSGWRLFIEYGVRIGSVFKYTPLGTFVCYDMDDDEDENGRLLSITGYDTTVLVRDGRFEAPYPIAASTNYATAMTDMMTAINLPSSFPATAYTTPFLLFPEGDDRLARLQDMNASLGQRAEADPYGTIIAKSIGTGQTEAVAGFVEGQGSRMVTVSRKRTRQGAYNIAVVVGEPAGATAPVYGVAYDDIPTSPTYYLGPFGRVPVFEKSQYITTTDQANGAAIGLLNRKRGIGTALRITSWAHPGLRPGDPVHVLRETMGVNQVIPLRSIDVSLRPGQPATFVTREGVLA